MITKRQLIDMIQKIKGPQKDEYGKYVNPSFEKICQEKDEVHHRSIYTYEFKLNTTFCVSKDELYTNPKLFTVLQSEAALRMHSFLYESIVQRMRKLAHNFNFMSRLDIEGEIYSILEMIKKE